jgi:ribosomal protein S18 acetylase RimI-like enzyme
MGAVGAPGIDVIQWGRERARTGPWRGNEAVAYLSPVPDAPTPSAAFVRRCLEDLSARGYRQVVTSALSPSESSGFLAAGFEITERLHLLAHDLERLPVAPAQALHAIRKGREDDEPGVLALDHRAFPPFWRLDGHGLAEALHATPHHRFRVAAGSADVPAGYAVYGRAGRRGYLQRLAVDPDERHHGLGTALVVDGLRWLRRWRAERVVVNTQFDNDGALRLYERLGFRRQPIGLSVLSAGLSDMSGLPDLPDLPE